MEILRARHVGGHRRQLHVDVRIEAKMPEAAFLVGERRIDRPEVQVQDAAVRLTGVVLGQGIRDGVGVVGARRLHDEPDVLVHGLLQCDQAFLGTALVVEGKELQFLSEHPASRVLLVDQHLEHVRAGIALECEGPAQGLDQPELDGVSG